jgi:hypothetical protein
LSNNKITRNYTSNIFLVFFASILTLSLFMFYMPIFSYSQTESDGILQEQQEQQQVCAEGEVFNEQTQRCVNPQQQHQQQLILGQKH